MFSQRDDRLIPLYSEGYKSSFLTSTFHRSERSRTVPSVLLIWKVLKCHPCNVPLCQEHRLPCLCFFVEDSFSESLRLDSFIGPLAICESNVSQSPAGSPVVESDVTSLDCLCLVNFACPGHRLGRSVRASCNLTAKTHVPHPEAAERHASNSNVSASLARCFSSPN